MYIYKRLRDMSGDDYPGTLRGHPIPHWSIVLAGSNRDVCIAIECPCCEGDQELTFDCNRYGCEHTVDCTTCEGEGWYVLDEKDGEFIFKGWGGYDEVAVPAEVVALLKSLKQEHDPQQLSIFEKTSSGSAE